MNLNIGVSEYEKPRLKFLWLLRFLFQVGLIFSWTIIASLFVTKVGFEYLPYLILIEAVVFFAGSIFANFIFLKVSNHSFMCWSTVGTIIFATIAFIFQENMWLFFSFALIAKNLFFSQLNIAIFRRNESLFSPNEARRLMPILDSAVTIGTIIAALIFLGLLQLFPVEQLIVWWNVPLLLMLVTISVSSKSLSEIPKLHDSYHNHEEHGQLSSGLKALMKTPFSRYIALIILLQAALFSAVDIEFLKSVDEHSTHQEALHSSAKYLQANSFTDSMGNIAHESAIMAKDIHESVTETAGTIFATGSLAHNLGMFDLCFGIIALLVQFFLTSTLLKRLGVAYTMISYVLLFLFSSISLLFSAGAINLVRGMQHGGFALFEVPYHMSFYSICPERRESLRHILEGLIRPLGIIMGVLFYLLAQYLLPADSAIPILFIALCFFILIFAIPLKHFYTKRCKSNLQSDDNISVKIQSIEIFGQMGHDNKIKELLRELKRKDIPLIAREKIIRTLTLIHDPTIVHVYLEILSDDSENHKMKIIILDSLLTFSSLRSYWNKHAFAHYHLLQVMERLNQETSSKHVRKLCIMNIFKHLSPHEVAPFFLKTLENAEDDLLSVCLRSAAEIFHDPELTYYLREYLHHKNPRLRGHAVISLWDFDDVGDLKKVLKELLNSSDREECIAGIYALGEVKDMDFENALFPYLDHHDSRIRAHALVALAKLGNPKSIYGLLEILFQSHPDEAKKVFSMLRRAPRKIQDQLKQEIHIMVSDHVLKVLLEVKVKNLSHLTNLPKEKRTYLKWLYRLAGRYEQALIFDQ